MKKRTLNALIAGSIATVGVLVTTSTALALYSTPLTDKSIGISITTSSDVTLAINDFAQTGTDALNPGKPLEFTYNLSGTKLASSTYTQSIVTGKLIVEVSSTSAVIDKISAVNDIDYMNEENSTWWEANRGTQTLVKNAAGTALTMEMYAPVKIEGGNNVKLTVSMSQIDITLAGSAINVNVQFLALTEDDTFPTYYVMGGIDGWAWQENDAALMVPNIAADAQQYMWFADKNYGVSTFKVKEAGTDNWYGSRSSGGVNNVEATLKAGDSIYYDIGNSYCTTLIL